MIHFALYLVENDAFEFAEAPDSLFIYDVINAQMNIDIT